MSEFIDLFKFKNKSKNKRTKQEKEKKIGVSKFLEIKKKTSLIMPKRLQVDVLLDFRLI